MKPIEKNRLHLYAGGKFNNRQCMFTGAGFFLAAATLNVHGIFASLITGSTQGCFDDILN